MKSKLTKMYHEFDDRSYEMEPCTLRILCLCGSCNPAKKIVPAENWRVNLTPGLVLKPIYYYYSSSFAISCFFSNAVSSVLHFGQLMFVYNIILLIYLNETKFFMKT